MVNSALVIGEGYKVNPLELDMERELVRRAQEGDSGAFGFLYDRLLHPIYVMCSSVSRMGLLPKT